MPTTTKKTDQMNQKKQQQEPLNKGSDQTNPRPESSCKVKVDRLEFDIFFDGTWNSKENSDWYNNPDNMHGERTDQQRMEKKYNPYLANLFFFKLGESISFARAPTGVDQMHRASDTSKPHIIPLYVDGAGAEIPKDVDGNKHQEYKRDNALGAGLGYGSTGIFAKMNKMFIQISDEIKQYNADQQKQVGQLIFNVYGFSRGAATARMFCNRIMNEKQLTLKYEDVPEEKFDLTKFSISLKMVGLFDTVTSIGADHLNDVAKDRLGLEFQLPEKEPTAQDVCIDISKRQITGKIVHLLAAHEFRQKFAVTNIKHAVENGYGFELALPGCHTDLGDGLGTEGEIRNGKWYIKGRDEEKTILQKYRVLYADATRELMPSLNPLQLVLPSAKSEGRAKKENAAANFEVVMSKLTTQGWYDNSNKELPEIVLKNNLIFEMLNVSRKQLSPDYPKVPTYIMIEFVKKYGAYHLKQNLLDKYSIDKSNDNNLKKIYSNLKDQALQLEALNEKKWVAEIYNNKQNEQPYINVTGNDIAVLDGRVKGQGKTLRKHLFNHYLHWGGEMGRGFSDLTLTQVNVSHIDHTTNEFYRTVING